MLRVRSGAWSSDPKKRIRIWWTPRVDEGESRDRRVPTGPSVRGVTIEDIHEIANTIPSRINRAEFDGFREQYWMSRANDFDPGN